MELIGSKNLGSVAFEDGKLKLVDNSLRQNVEFYHMMFGEDNKETIFNNQLRKRILTLARQKLDPNDPDTAQWLDSIQKYLEIDKGQEKSFPLSRDKLLFTLRRIYKISSHLENLKNHHMNDVDFLQKNAIEASYALFDLEKKEDITEEDYKKKLQKIIKSAQKQGVILPSFTAHQLDGMANVRWYEIREETFASMEQVYNMAVHLNQGNIQQLRKNFFWEREENNMQNPVAEKIAALIMGKYAAANEAEKESYKLELDAYLKSLAFKIIDHKRAMDPAEAPTESMCRKMDLTMLSSANREALADLVKAKASSVREWKRKEALVQDGTEHLGQLCENLKAIHDLMNVCFREGLSAEESKRLKEAGQKVDELLLGEHAKNIELVALGLEGTDYAEGYHTAMERRKEGFSFTQSVVNLLAKTLPVEKEDPIAQENAVLEIQQPGLGEMLENLDEKSRKVVNVLRMEGNPTDLIEMAEDQNAISIKNLRDVLHTFESGKVAEGDIKLADLDVKLIQKADNSLYAVVKGQPIPLTRTAEQYVEILDDDFMEHTNLYGEEYARSLIREYDLLKEENETSSERRRSRHMLVKYLAGKLGKADTFFTNVTAKEIKKWTYNLMTGSIPKESIIRLVNGYDSTVHIHGEETLTLLREAAQNKDRMKVEYQPPQAKHIEGEKEFSEEANKVKNLLADMIFSTKVEEQEKSIAQSGAHIKETLIKNSSAIRSIIVNPEILKELIDQLPFEDQEEEIAEVQQEQGEKQAQKKIRSKKDLYEFIVEKIDGILDEIDLEELEAADRKMNQAQNIFNKFLNFLGGDEKEEEKKEEIKKEEKKINDPKAEKLAHREKVKDFLKRHDRISDATIAIKLKEMPANEFGAPINEAVRMMMGGMQKEINDSLGVLFQKNQEQNAAPNQADQEGQVVTLDSILDESVTANAGQGKFMRLVLSEYFEKSSLIDQKSMLASCIRNLKPKQEVKEGLSEKEKKAAEEEVEKMHRGNFIAGILKGAGPLLQKMLQGVPTKGISKDIAEALEDMKSNLAPIPEEIVKAKMQEIIDRSKGRITGIKVVKALGAASVGQAFKCQLEGPEFKEPKNVVIKLLRPEARNRMLREKKIMLECAKKTDQQYDNNGHPIPQKYKGGMQATYEGQLQRIEEELDLTIEARNAEKGSLYNYGFQTVKSEKIDHTIAPTTDTLIIEEASGNTLDRYLKEVREKVNQLYDGYFEKDENGQFKELQKNTINGKEMVMLESKTMTAEKLKKLPSVYVETRKLLDQAILRQQYLSQMVSTWMFEAVYGEGFYHGDLHAGNIMIDDKSITLIDYGNATILNEMQKKHVTRMMIAAGIGNVNIFQDSFHALLENTPESVYKEKKAEIKNIFKEVLKLGNQNDAGKRIAAALLKAQNLGLELPPAIYNLSQCQQRLENAVSSINAEIEQMQKIILNISKIKGSATASGPYSKMLFAAFSASLNDAGILHSYQEIMKPVDAEAFKTDYTTMKKSEFTQKYLKPRDIGLDKEDDLAAYFTFKAKFMQNLGELKKLSDERKSLDKEGENRSEEEKKLLEEKKLAIQDQMVNIKTVLFVTKDAYFDDVDLGFMVTKKDEESTLPNELPITDDIDQMMKTAERVFADMESRIQNYKKMNAPLVEAISRYQLQEETMKEKGLKGEEKAEKEKAELLNNILTAYQNISQKKMDEVDMKKDAREGKSYALNGIQQELDAMDPKLIGEDTLKKMKEEFLVLSAEFPKYCEFMEEYNKKQKDFANFQEQLKNREDEVRLIKEEIEEEKKKKSINYAHLHELNNDLELRDLEMSSVKRSYDNALKYLKENESTYDKFVLPFQKRNDSFFEDYVKAIRLMIDEDINLMKDYPLNLKDETSVNAAPQCCMQTMGDVIDSNILSSLSKVSRWNVLFNYRSFSKLRKDQNE